MHFANRGIWLLIPLSLVALISGCPTDPKRTVTLILDGPEDLNSRIVEHSLRSIVDSGGFSMSSTRIGNGPTKVNLYPVRNIEAFSHKIRFGTIDKIEGRRIYITVDKASAELSIATAITIKFIEDFPDRVQWGFWELRVLLISYYTGESYNQLLWEDVWKVRQTQSTIGK